MIEPVTLILLAAVVLTAARDLRRRRKPASVPRLPEQRNLAAQRAAAEAAASIRAARQN
jgi:hypothetical protein